MISKGQLIFAILFFVSFVIAIVFAYRKDIKIHQTFYKGNYKILISFFLFIAILFVIKVYFKR
jgi:short subunit fatty acids transporter